MEQIIILQMRVWTVFYSSLVLFSMKDLKVSNTFFRRLFLFIMTMSILTILIMMLIIFNYVGVGECHQRVLKPMGWVTQKHLRIWIKFKCCYTRFKYQLVNLLNCYGYLADLENCLRCICSHTDPSRKSLVLAETLTFSKSIRCVCSREWLSMVHCFWRYWLELVLFSLFTYQSSQLLNLIWCTFILFFCFKYRLLFRKSTFAFIN